MRWMLILAAALLAAPVGAQLYIPPALDTSGLVTAAQMASAMAAAVASKADASTVTSLAAAIPTPASTVPGMETVSGAAGATATYRRGDAIQPRITRTASCSIVLTSGISSCDAGWDGTAFPNGTTIRLAGAPAVVTTTQGTSTEQPITCKAYAVTLIGVSFRCWASQTLSINLAGVTAGLNLSPFAGAASGALVQVVGIPTS